MNRGSNVITPIKKEQNADYKSSTEIARMRESIEIELDGIEDKQNEINSKEYIENLNNNYIPIYFRNIPEKYCDSPRDYRNIIETKDVMFIAIILSRTVGEYNILEFIDKNGMYHYILDEPTSSEKSIYKNCRLSKKITLDEIINIFKVRFYDFRYALSTYKNNSIECRVLGQRLKSFGNVESLRLWKFGKSLTHPFYRGGDQLLAEMRHIKFLEWINTTSTELTKGHAFCPLDGPVKTLQATLKIFKKNVMYAEWMFECCPKCLGVFDEKNIKIYRNPLQLV